MDRSFSRITFLEYRLKAAEAEVSAFKSGKKYQKIHEVHRKEVKALEQEIRHRKEETAQARRDMAAARNHWFEVFEDLQKEHRKEKAALQKQLAQMEKRALKAEHERDEALDKVTQQRHKLYEAETQLEEEKGKNLRLKAQLNHGHENSSIPSSKTIRRKKITNSREKTGKKPGGQPGHKGHCRRKQEPTAVVFLEPPREILEDPDFRKTSKTLVKQQVEVRLVLEVTEYHADVYYNSKTGERFHAPFPEGVTDDVNYGGSIKAFLFLLNNDCCTSIDKSRRFLSDLTDGKLNISKGMVNKLSREFAAKTEAERKKVFTQLLLSPVLHTDCTNALLNGKSAYVFICASPDGKALYFARQKKGHKGVEGTPVQDYDGIIVQDHEATFYQYGSDHQECLAHVLRALKDSMENEPDRSWNKEMHSHMQEMIHYRNSLEEGEECDPEVVSGFEARYRQILQKAKEEYEYLPPNKYYKKGHNLSIRLEEYMHNHFLFLYDQRVPATNNEAERLLRGYKRKQQQAVSFRSFESIESLCQCMSMLVMMREEESVNLFGRVSQIFG